MGHSENSASTSLAPGFRFHPTDEELVSYYLKRKICGKPFRFDAICEIDIYKAEPWDLPGLSKLKSRDLEWYFFSGLDKKYGNGSRTNRATLEGYWKTTGKDRPIHHRSRVVGMKKTLVYHLGRAPHGKRTNWVMHEYKLVDETLEKAGYSVDGVVLCRIFQKSGSGPKNGEKYGAPFVEEEWENDDIGAMVPGNVSFEEPSIDDDAFIEQNDLEQNSQLPGDVPFPANHYHEDNNICVEDFIDITGSEEKSLPGESEYNSGLKVLDDQHFYDLPMQVGSNVDVVMNKHLAQPNGVTCEVSTNYLSNGTSSDTVSDAPFDDGLFLDAIDFLDHVDENTLDFGDIQPYLEEDDIAQYLSFDSPPELMSSDANQAFSTKENLDHAFCQLPSASQQLIEPFRDGIASSSQRVMDVPKNKPSKPDMQYPFLGQAGRLLGNIPAPPAFASEFPTKDLAAWLSALQSSSSVRVTAGMIRISDMAAGNGGSRLQWSFDKTGNVNVVVSFELPQDVSQAGLDSLSGMLSTKMAAGISRGWSRFLLCCVFVFALTFKIAFCIYVK